MAVPEDETAIAAAMARCKSAATACERAASGVESELAAVHGAWRSASSATEAIRRALNNLEDAREALARVERHFSAADEAHMTLSRPAPALGDGDLAEQRASYEEALARCVNALQFLGSRNGRKFASAADERRRIEELLHASRQQMQTQMKEVATGLGVASACLDGDARRDEQSGAMIAACRWLVATALSEQDSRSIARGYGVARAAVVASEFARFVAFDPAAARCTVAHDRPYQLGSHVVLRHYEVATTVMCTELGLASTVAETGAVSEHMRRAVIEGAVTETVARLRRAVRNALEHVATAPSEDNHTHGGIIANAEAARAALDMLNRHKSEFSSRWMTAAEATADFETLADDWREGAADAVRATIESVASLFVDALDLNDAVRAAVAGSRDVCVAAKRLEDAPGLPPLPSSCPRWSDTFLRDISVKLGHAELVVQDSSDYGSQNGAGQATKQSLRLKRRGSFRFLGGASPNLASFSKSLRNSKQSPEDAGAPHAPDSSPVTSNTNSPHRIELARSLVAELLQAVAAKTTALRSASAADRAKSANRDQVEDVIFAGAALDALVACRAEYFLVVFAGRLRTDLDVYSVSLDSESDSQAPVFDELSRWLDRLKAVATSAFLFAWTNATEAAAPFGDRDARKLLESPPESTGFHKSDAAALLKRRFATVNAYLDRLAVPMRSWFQPDLRAANHIRKSLLASLYHAWADFYRRYSAHPFTNKHLDVFLRWSPPKVHDAITCLFQGEPPIPSPQRPDDTSFSVLHADEFVPSSKTAVLVANSVASTRLPIAEEADDE